MTPQQGCRGLGSSLARIAPNLSSRRPAPLFTPRYKQEQRPHAEQGADHAEPQQLPRAAQQPAPPAQPREAPRARQAPAARQGLSTPGAQPSAATLQQSKQGQQPETEGQHKQQQQQAAGRQPMQNTPAPAQRPELQQAQAQGAHAGQQSSAEAERPANQHPQLAAKQQASSGPQPAAVDGAPAPTQVPPPKQPAPGLHPAAEPSVQRSPVPNQAPAAETGQPSRPSVGSSQPSAVASQPSPARGGLQPAQQPASPQQPREQAAQQPAQQSSLYQESSPDVDVVEGDVRIIALGQRGISAASRLMSNVNLQGAEFWVLDTDPQVLAGSAAPNMIHITQDEAQLSPRELGKLAGPAALAAATASSQRPGSPVPTCGVAFLLGGAGSVPGGSTLMLQIASHLRRLGFFVAAVVTRPFEFEGRRRLEEADALIEALQDVAQLVVVVRQGVLLRASADLTMAQASATSDNILEVSCRAVLWALGAPEVLQASGGVMLWHGRDLRQYKRLLSPPLEVLLTCPGVGVLGRGMASLPLTSLTEVGLASGLSTLAEDAVTSAFDSPFLESALPCASGVLCILSLPARVMSHDLSMARGALNDPEKYAIRAAVQVAAMTITSEVTSRHCEQVVVCAHVRPDWPHTDPSLLCLEATLMVLESPTAAEERAASAAPASQAVQASAATAAQRAAIAPKGPLQATQYRPPQPQQQQPGGQQGQPQQQQRPAAAGAPPSSPRPRSVTRSAEPTRAGGSPEVPIMQAQFKPGPPRLTGSSQLPASGRPVSPGVRLGAAAALGRPGSSSSSNGSGALLGRGSPQPRQQQQQQGKGGGEPALVKRMTDKLASGLKAASLDLPPTAAAWRNQQRQQKSQQQQGQQQQGRGLAAHFPLAAIPWSSSQRGGAAGGGLLAGAGGVAAGKGGGAGGDADAADDGDDDGGAVGQARDLKSRVEGMLSRERYGDE